ncbi:MAG: 1-deoxy-D-xylulose-5-phosphate synthase, partial [Spirochaetota bacterium]
MSYKYLEKINYPAELRKLEIKELPEVCREIREYIIDTLSGIGGHFSSNLGAVEFTVALHYVFETPKDRLFWDVGHQTYPHKILTGRRESLKTVRQYGGISGFPKREESEYDLYNTGHAGTSISQLIGEAVARDMTGGDYNCIAIIGDASFSAGMALEAMNHGGHLKPNCLVVLNDNYMSISKNVGSISTYLNNIISSQFYNRSKKVYFTLLKWLPFIGPALLSFVKRVEKSFKDVLVPGGLFEDLGFRYIGPVDGHNVIQLVNMLRKLKDREGPVLLHVLTQKGKGYTPAEKDPIKYHGVTPFDKTDGAMSASQEKIGYSKIIGETLKYLTDRNKKVVAVTPAMIEGSGLKAYAKAYPDHVHDVGIAEQHAVTFAASLLGGGIVPYMCIYSTFMTRGMDQVVHDVSLMNLPLRFVIDRAGCVGADGETHQGLFDIGFLCALPNMTVLAPSNGQDLIDCMKYMETYDKGPIAIRFPKAAVSPDTLDYEKTGAIQAVQSRVLQSGTSLCLLSVGSMLEISQAVAVKLQEHGFSVTVVDLFWIRPLDQKTIEEEISKTEHFAILDESYLDSGVSGYILNRIPANLLAKFIKTFAFPPESIQHGARDKVRKHYKIDSETIS